MTFGGAGSYRRSSSTNARARLAPNLSEQNGSSYRLPRGKGGFLETAEEATGPYNAVELDGCSRLGLHACRQSSRRGAWKWLYHKSPRSLATLSTRKHRRTRRFAGVRGPGVRILLAPAKSLRTFGTSEYTDGSAVAVDARIRVAARRPCRPCFGLP